MFRRIQSNCLIYPYPLCICYSLTFLYTFRSFVLGFQYLCCSYFHPLLFIHIVLQNCISSNLIIKDFSVVVIILAFYGFITSKPRARAFLEIVLLFPVGITVWILLVVVILDFLLVCKNFPLLLGQIPFTSLIDGQGFSVIFD